MAAMAIGFPPPPHLIALRNSALGAAAAAEASILLLEVVKSLAPGTVRINEGRWETSPTTWRRSTSSGCCADSPTSSWAWTRSRGARS